MIPNVSSIAAYGFGAIRKPATSPASSAGSMQGAGASPGTAAAYGSAMTGRMSIAQIRGVTDRMAVSGKLTIRQQMALIGGGLMDPNPADPGGDQATPGIQVGYSRADGGSYDFVGMMQSAAQAAASSGLNDIAGIYSGIAQSFQDYVSASRIDVSA